MDRTSLLWVLVLFFGTALVFGGLRRLTEDQSAGVVIGVQFAALALIVWGVVAYVRRRE